MSVVGGVNLEGELTTGKFEKLKYRLFPSNGYT